MRDANHYQIGTFPPARSPKAVQSASQPLIIDCSSEMMIFRAGTMMIGSLIGWIRLIRLSENRKPKKTEKNRKEPKRAERAEEARLYTLTGQKDMPGDVCGRERVILGRVED